MDGGPFLALILCHHGWIADILFYDTTLLPFWGCVLACDVFVCPFGSRLVGRRRLGPACAGIIGAVVAVTSS